MAEERKSRIGFLADGDPDTGLMSALYEYDETGVRLHVPFLSHEDERSRWWSQGMLHMDDPHRTKYRYNPPSELNYVDSKGSVGLLGCVSGGANTSMGNGVGRGTIRARYALEMAQDAANYIGLNGLRSEIDSLSYWLAYSAHQTTIKMPKGGGPAEITTTMRPADDLVLGRRLNLRAIAVGTAPSAWSPEVAYSSRVFIETFSKSRRKWEDHLALHFAIRNLVRVAGWHPINFQSHQAVSVKEARKINGKAWNQWREVRTATTGIAGASWKASDRFLFYFSDVGTVGVARWLKLVARYERGITPLVGLLDLEGATVDAFISQLGIALEAVGYQALIDSGSTPASANRTNIAKRIAHLLHEISGNFSFADTTFAQDFADSYNSVKHANRTVVAPDVKLRHVRQGVELLRIWVALRLGVEPATLKSRH